MNEFISEDELVSSVLDGEGDEAARALVAGDPALQRRLAAFEQVSTAVGATGAPPVGLEDRVVSAALATSSLGVAATSSPSRFTRSSATFAMAAVVALAILLPVGFLVARSFSDSGGDQGDIASGPTNTEAPGGGPDPLTTTIPVLDPDDLPEVEAPSHGEPGTTPTTAPSSTRPSSTVNLGNLSGPSAVASAIADHDSSTDEAPDGSAQSPPDGEPGPPPGEPAPGAGAPDGETPEDPDGQDPDPGDVDPEDPGEEPPDGEPECPQATDDPATVEMVASATFQGVPATIVVISTDTERSALVLDRDSCEVLAEVPL